MALPTPEDPNFKPPVPSERDFNNPGTVEDEALLETGAWDDEPDDDDELIDEKESDQ